MNDDIACFLLVPVESNINGFTSLESSGWGQASLELSFHVPVNFMMLWFLQNEEIPVPEEKQLFIQECSSKPCKRSISKL